MSLVVWRAHRPFLLLVAALILSLAYGNGRPAFAASFIVDSPGDLGDATPGDGACDIGWGPCTLRAAVQEANALPGADTISLPAGTYTLDIVGSGEDASATGDLDITGNLTINGAGMATTIVDGGAVDTVFEILSGATVEITAITVRNGSAGGYPGGISNDGTLHMSDCKISGNHATGGNAGGARNGGTMVLNNCVVADNTAKANGGGLYNRYGTLTLNGSTVSGNATTDFDGGGIGNNAGAVNLNNSTISGNTAGATGGGIWSDSGLVVTASTITGNLAAQRGGGIYSDGTLTLTNSTVSNNTAAQFEGGGIFVNQGTADLSGSTVSDNTAEGTGGGIRNDGAVTIANSTVRGNSAGGDGGGIDSHFGTLDITNTAISDNTAHGWGGGISNDATLTLTNSALANNHADIQGGGISDPGDATLTNVTVSGNSVPGNGTGGVYNSSGNMTITNSTIVGNSASHTGGLRSLTTATLKNTIVADNTGPDCTGNTGAITSVGHNLDSDGSCELAALGDLSNVADAKIGPLADNGGPTLTRALLAGSPAIDAGSSDCPPPATDQRGVARPQGPACDIGAFEAPSSGQQVKWGDVHCDGAVDSVDSLGDLRYLAHLSPLPHASDCPEIDETVEVAGASPHAWGVNSLDALRILRYVAHLSLTPIAGCPDVGAEVTIS